MAKTHVKVPPRVSDFLRAIDEAAGHRDRAAIIMAGSYLEAELASALKTWLVPASQDYADGIQMAAKMNLARALGLVSDEEHSALQKLIRVRNYFAHHILEATVDAPALRDCWDVHEVLNFHTDQADRTAYFTFAVATMVIRLKQRLLQPGEYLAEVNRRHEELSRRKTWYAKL